MKLALALVTVASLHGVPASPPLAPMALSSLTRAPADITATPVMNQSGQVIGKAQRIVSDQDGKPSGMSYVARDGKLVVVAAPAVSYDGHMFVTADNPQRVASAD